MNSCKKKVSSPQFIPSFKRVIILTEYFPPHWTGLAKSIYYYAKEKTLKNYQVTVITTRFSSSLDEVETMEGMLVYRLPFLFRISRTHYSPQTILYFWLHIKFADEVVINSPHSNIFFLTIISKIFKKKITVFHQGDLILPKFQKQRIRKFFIEKTFDLMTIPSMCLADEVATYTKDYAVHSRVMRFFKKKLKVIIPFIPKPPKVIHGEIFLKLKEMRTTYRLVGFSGRFVEEKGFDLLLSAVPWIVEKDPHVLFLFAGETKIFYENYFSFHQEKIEKNKLYLHFLGLLDQDELWQFYKSLDVFVLCSRSDCFALTQVEAALCGVPIVATDIPGARVLVKETGCGKLVPPESPEEIGKAIIEILKNPSPFLNKQREIESFLYGTSTGK